MTDEDGFDLREIFGGFHEWRDAGGGGLLCQAARYRSIFDSDLARSTHLFELAAFRFCMQGLKPSVAE
jgi:hypothetical protein